ncbi:bifunctional diguanylate cyclase/phosphodiesterase [Anaerospora sp.]|uniref:putative bifunctional diguanylate cyclase/phosphodiesterase n=1 Tax=Anaerospora sp. TaxID=1960278 RepID=UPI00289E6B3D|nr:bifunctional diguanylate cyclase/phosphodiesterase [Anaerospora sp.]
MNSSKLALTLLFTAMFALTFYIRSFVADELSNIEYSVKTVQDENVKQLSKVVEVQGEVNKVPWLVSRLIISEGEDKRQYIEKQIIVQIDEIEKKYMNDRNHREDEEALHTYVGKNWQGYRTSVLQVMSAFQRDKIFEARDRMEDSLLYLERVNDGLKMFVALHERDVADKTGGIVRIIVLAKQNMMILVMVALLTFIFIGVIAFRKITSTEKQLRKQAYHDDLTGLPNRFSFQQTMREELQKADRPDNGAVLFLDMDNFKIINDHYGHDAGDQFLVIIANRIRSLFGEDVFGARFGGDEFALFLRKADEKQVEKLLSELRGIIAEPVQVQGVLISPTPSIGVAFYPHHGDTVVELLKNADIAMYQAKSKKNAYVIYEAKLLSDITARQLMEQSLKQAVDRNEFSLVYQPLICVKTHQIIGLEALLRWKSGQLGDVSPVEFIPLAEATGTIIPIGCWVLNHAAAMIKTLEQLGARDIFISVNVSVIQLMQEDFIDIVEKVVTTQGIALNSLKIEITETVLVESFPLIKTKIKLLRDMGIKICLDDFGTGYSSINYLTRLPLDILKLDKSLVRDLNRNERSQVVFRNLIQMAHGIGIKVVAEGVETQQQMELIQGLGCDYAQGYYISKPVGAEDVIQLSMKRP